MKSIWESHLQISLKMKIFDCLVRSVYLYNSELWTVTKSIKSSINATHRRLLRIALNIKYPQIISNERLVEITKQTPWTKIIDVQRLRWLGHLLRLPEDCPARISLNEFERPVKKTSTYNLGYSNTKTTTRCWNELGRSKTNSSR